MAIFSLCFTIGFSFFTFTFTFNFYSNFLFHFFEGLSFEKLLYLEYSFFSILPLFLVAVALIDFHFFDIVIDKNNKKENPFSKIYIKKS